jgi:hypothetical protein
MNNNYRFFSEQVIFKKQNISNHRLCTFKILEFYIQVSISRILTVYHKVQNRTEWMNAEAYIFYLQQQAAHGYIGYDQIYSP